MGNRIRLTAIALAVSLCTLTPLPSAAAGDMGSAASDTGSAAFNRYVQDLHGRMQSIESGRYWVSTLVDEMAFNLYLSALGESAGGPGMDDTATYLASVGQDASPLRTFNSYLAYLGQRMRADAGPAGALLANDKGTQSFDRYIEDINYRIQMLYQAEDAL
jgi:hypothetical protein